MIRSTIFITALFFICTASHPSKNVRTEAFEQLMSRFDREYEALNIPPGNYDYRQEMQAIPGLEHIGRQIAFFETMRENLNRIRRDKLMAYERLQYDHLDYEIDLNLMRLTLEKAWRQAPATAIPTGGLSTLDKDWYRYRIRFFTSVDISPEELFRFGASEVDDVQEEILKIRSRPGFAADSAGFYERLRSDSFVLNDKAEILRRYEEIKTTVYGNLHRLFADTGVANIAFMEWPQAGPFTPPGYYSPPSDNAYGTGVFFFNFYNQRHNRRSMDWLFLHEAVPGHHYQWCLREKLPAQPAFKRHFYYPGNFEGWAAYVEYFGKELGLYRDDFAELGKWEWDLVRSVRILIDVGIHHYGWSKEEALACWKKYIPGQDDIAEREVTRCTNWPAQALSYKVGAWKIRQMADRLKRENPGAFSLPAFHRAYLMAGQTPVEVVEKNIDALTGG
ncbi:MAG: DUF885 domain-containing protein [Thermoanaerobaculia bacterium]|nr:DUF885 domain-containing protein [Thermoanaerobaculia bacterium]